MPETYDISELKRQLENLTGKEVHLYEKEDKFYNDDITKDILEEYMRRAFRLMLRNLAVKNVFKAYLKHFLSKLQNKNNKQIDDTLVKERKFINEFYEKLTMEKDLFI